MQRNRIATIAMGVLALSMLVVLLLSDDWVGRLIATVGMVSGLAGVIAGLRERKLWRVAQNRGGDPPGQDPLDR